MLLRPTWYGTWYIWCQFSSFQPSCWHLLCSFFMLNIICVIFPIEQCVKFQAVAILSKVYCAFCCNNYSKEWFFTASRSSRWPTRRGPCPGSSDRRPDRSTIGDSKRRRSRYRVGRRGLRWRWGWCWGAVHIWHQYKGIQQWYRVVNGRIFGLGDSSVMFHNQTHLPSKQNLAKGGTAKIVNPTQPNKQVEHPVFQSEDWQL